jgi:hypothetical protein
MRKCIGKYFIQLNFLLFLLIQAANYAIMAMQVESSFLELTSVLFLFLDALWMLIIFVILEATKNKEENKISDNGLWGLIWRLLLVGLSIFFGATCSLFIFYVGMIKIFDSLLLFFIILGEISLFLLVKVINLFKIPF